MLTFIGDVHGDSYTYNNIVTDLQCSVQLGDFGFSYSCITADPQRHKILGGNHDNYDEYPKIPYSLPHYGSLTLGGVNFSFIRGGFSIDKHMRVKYEVTTGQKVWWEEEQLDKETMMKAHAFYCYAKPEIMISHSCPRSVANKIGNPSILLYYGHDPYTFSTDTQDLLQDCLNFHQPKIWIFGHFHKYLRNVKLKGCKTSFNCVESVSYGTTSTHTLTIDSKGNILDE